MGYAVTAPMKSQKAKAEMLAFLSEHYRPISEFIDEPSPAMGETFHDYDSSRFIRTEDGYLDFDTGEVVEGDGSLCYDSGSSKIGFEYTACAFWPFLMCRWMALRAGRKRRFKAVEDGTLSVPYYVYDGYEAVPLVVEDRELEVEDLSRGYEIVRPSGFRYPPTSLRMAAEGWPTTIEELQAAIAATEEKIQFIEDRGESEDIIRVARKPFEESKSYAEHRLGQALVHEACKAELDRLTQLWEAR